MYMVDNVPIETIAEMTGYAAGKAILAVKDKFGLPARTRQYLFNSLARQMFTDEQEQILLGSLLGDGCIMDRSSRNPIYTETHSIHQLEYISWKQTKLYPFITRVSIGHKNTQAQIRSVALPQLKFYRGVFYPDGNKLVPVEALDWLDDIAVAVWYMDDGSMHRESGLIRLATCAFNLRTVGMLQGWLAAKYKILSYVRVDKGIYPIISIQRESNDRFLKLVEPYVIPSMRYKLGQ